MSETAILSIMVAALIGGGAYTTSQIAEAYAKAQEIRQTTVGHN